MGASQITICNLALSKIGGGTITALDEGSAAASACKLIYDSVLAEVLQLRPWASCIARTTLARLAQPPAFEWANAFELPADFLGLVRLGADCNHSPPYAIEGRGLLTNEEAAPVLYVYLNNDPMSYEAALVDLIASRMAVELAMSVAGNASLKGVLAQEYEVKRQRAKAVDGQSVGVPDFVSDTFADARL